MAATLQPGKGRIYYMDPETQRVRLDNKGPWLEVEQIQTSRPIAVIDPGHGVQKSRGADYGADSYGTPESKIVYDIGMMVGNRFASQGFDVIVTRNVAGDRGEALPKVANGFRFRHEATQHENTAFLISLHADAHTHNHASGTRIIFDSRNQTGSLSHQIREEIAENKSGNDIIIDEHMRERKLAVLSPRYLKNNTRIPAILVEMGFLSNHDDKKNLNNIHWRRDFADELVNDTTAFYKQSLSTRVFAQVAKEPGHRYPYYYTIEAGDTVYNIAQRFGLGKQGITALEKANPELKDGASIFPGQQLLIPDRLEYTVQQGDNLTKVLKRFNLNPQEIADVNPNIKNLDLIKQGDALIIPGFALKSVERGGSIYKILDAAYGSDYPLSHFEKRELAECIVDMNDLKSATAIHPGDQLVIPYTLEGAHEACEINPNNTRHEVRAGESLNNILREQYDLNGKKLGYGEISGLSSCIAGLNGLSSPTDIHPGDTLNLPKTLDAAQTQCDSKTR